MKTKCSSIMLSGGHDICLLNLYHTFYFKTKQTEYVIARFSYKFGFVIYLQNSLHTAKKH